MTNKDKMTNFRWVICAMLFFATTVNYLDRQVLSLTWDEFIKPEFHWDESHYGTVTSIFSIIYAISMVFAGRFVDWLGAKKGYLWAIGIWSLGACMHAFCGIVTEAVAGMGSAAELVRATGDAVVLISTVSMYCFLVARSVLAIGESGNFPAAIKTTAEYFPKKDRAFATSIFNAGASIGALIAPLTIPLLAKAYGWEMAFIIIGVLGFIWMGVWVFVYDKPENSKYVNAAELEYIRQDKLIEASEETAEKSKKLGIKTTEPLGMALIFTLYAITMLSIIGGKLPTVFIDKAMRRGKGFDPYSARMKAMLIFALFPICVLLAQPLGTFSPWFAVVLIGIGCAAHQSWSANVYTTVGDMFPNSAVATVTGIGGMAGGISSMIMQKFAGELFVWSDKVGLQFLGFEGKPAGYFIIFCICAFAYVIGWLLMKVFVPKYSVVTLED